MKWILLFIAFTPRGEIASVFEGIATYPTIIECFEERQVVMDSIDSLQYHIYCTRPRLPDPRSQ